ncbi:MAG: hypothetical protein M3Y78_03135, partial [Pseudomonadota bacterium]|nr:hypothetical protein [Pseudomonadota bacterium]
VYAPTFVLDAGTLVVRPRPSEGADVDNAATVIVDFPGEGDGTYYGETKIVLPAGEQKLTVRIGKGEASETFELAAGQTVEKDIVVGVGKVTANAFYAEGGEKASSSSMFVRIFRAAKKIDGSREEIAYSYGPDQDFSLPTGDYVARIDLDKAFAEQPFNIRAGEVKSVTAVLDAGVLAVTAPGAKDIKVFAAKKDMQGEREAFGYGFDGAHQTTLPAGDYIVVTDRRDGSPVKETPASVKAGGRVELTIQ